MDHITVHTLARGYRLGSGGVEGGGWEEGLMQVPSCSRARLEHAAAVASRGSMSMFLDVFGTENNVVEMKQIDLLSLANMYK